MTCAYCRRPIGRKAIDAHHYSRSSWTSNHYCCRPDCMRVGRKLVAVELELRKRVDELRNV